MIYLSCTSTEEITVLHQNFSHF